MEKSETSKPSLFSGAVIFGGLFALVGLIAFCGIVGPQTLHYFQSLQWEPVPVELARLSGDSELHYNEGKSSRHYTLKAQYSYRYQGVPYVSEQVTLDDRYDSDEDYWRGLETRIRGDNVRSELQAWVNPDEPQKSVLETGYRWKKLIFGSLFLVMFGGMGLGLAWLSIRQKAQKQALDAGVNGIKPNNLLAEKIFFFFALIILLLSIPIMTTVPKEIAKGNMAILLIALLPLMGSAFLYHGLRAMKRRKLFGPTLLMADPLPGCVGGQVGGAFEVSADADDRPLQARLECVRVSRGKNSSRSLIWQDHQVVYAQRSAAGSRHQFSLDVSEELPPSGDKDRSYIEWSVTAEGSLRVDGHSQPFSRSWTIPVVRGEQRTSDTAPTVFKEKAREQKLEAAEESAAEQISFVAETNELELISRSGRNGKTMLMLSVFGVVFFSVGLFPLYLALQGDAALWIFAVVFCLVGLIILAASLWSWGRQLEVRLVDDELLVIRRWFSKPLYQRRLNIPQAEDVSIKSTMKSQTSGQASTEYFALLVKTGGKKQVIAEGIEGRHAAEALISKLQDWLVLRVEAERVTESSAG